MHICSIFQYTLYIDPILHPYAWNGLSCVQGSQRDQITIVTRKISLLEGATVNGGNGKWKRKAEKGNGRHSNTYTYSYQCQDRSSSSKSRSASLGRCKTWTLDSGTHELTDIWTPDKTINDDMTHMPCIQPCPSSVQCTSGGFGD